MAAFRQEIADGTSEQAVAAEESSASLGEMASRTQSDAENANQAEEHMAEMACVMSEGGYAMDKLIAYMGAIKAASDETSKIIKTIDEIAFQANRLALNVAAEAALTRTEGVFSGNDAEGTIPSQPVEIRHRCVVVLVMASVHAHRKKEKRRQSQND